MRAFALLLLLFASAVSTSTKAEPARFCNIGPLSMRGPICDRVAASGLQPTDLHVELNLYGKQRSFFSCALNDAIIRRRLAIRPVPGKNWNLQQAAEFGTAYKAHFSRLAQQAIGVVAVDFGAGPCVDDSPIIYIISTFERLEILEGQSSCRATRKLLLIRLSDVCAGEVQVIALRGIRQLGDIAFDVHQLTALLIRKFSLELNGDSQIFATIETFRTRWTDIDAKQK